MAFFKRNSDNTLIELSNVVTTSYSLLATENGTYSYPFDDWYWFDLQQDAEASIPLIGEHPPENRVSMRQARLALYDFGLLAMVDGFIKGMEGEAGDKAKIEWETADFVEKDSPLVQLLIHVLGKTQEEIDALFAYALTK